MRKLVNLLLATGVVVLCYLTYKNNSSFPEQPTHANTGATPSVQANSTAAATTEQPAIDQYDPSRWIALTNIGYQVLYDPIFRLPRLVHYHLSDSTYQSGTYHQFDRSELQFRADPRVPNPADPSEYRFNQLELDKGHLAPNYAISRFFGREAQDQTFYLTNVIPQKHWHNAGIWETAEKIEAKNYVFRFHSLDVYDGPIFADPRHLANNPHLKSGLPIPIALYKAWIRPDGHRLGFIIPQLQEQYPEGNLQPFIVPISTIQSYCGLQLPNPHPELPDATKLW